MTNIPYFKEVVIMATVCDICGHKTNEVKSGGGIEDKGKKITLRLTDPSDLNRDVLKSETCSVAIPELEFEIGGGSLGGRFTTVEGLLNNIQVLEVGTGTIRSGRLG
jgi:zinc finger protein